MTNTLLPLLNTYVPVRLQKMLLRIKLFQSFHFRNFMSNKIRQFFFCQTRVNAEGVTANNFHWFSIFTLFNPPYFKLMGYSFALNDQNNVKMTGIPPPGVPMDTQLTFSS